MNQVQFEEILSRVNKPARYLGNEINSVKKDFLPDTIKVALCFPDIYEVGMSYLGLRILYSLLNKQDDIACERIFLPDNDFIGVLKEMNIPLFSLESKTPLSKFDILGFSINYELNYPNILHILRLSDIPSKQNERIEKFPLIIAGGNCCLNPEPLADFFDLFVLGEAEEVILEIIDTIRDYKLSNNAASSTKKDLLCRLARIEGVYVPSLYKVEYYNSGWVKTFTPSFDDIPKQIKKRFIKNLDHAHYPTKWILPYISIVHDRIALEIMRGCPNQCAFCQAKNSFWPLRKRSIHTIVNLAKLLYESSGYEKISLLSLSTSDYPEIKELAQTLVGCFSDNGVSISLPSLKAKSIVSDLAQVLASIRKSALTFAPEAGTQGLRQLINKNFDVESFFEVLDNARKIGYRHIKLYFMIGLPTETKEDIDGIIDFASCISNKYKINFTISIANFIPKPHTPFQWLNMDTLESLKEKQVYIRNNTKHARRNLKIDFHDVYMSFIECLLARGDRRLSEVIIGVSNNDFDYNIWQQIMLSHKIDHQFYCHRKNNSEDIFPWDYIDIGINKKYLFAQLQNALTKRRL